MRKILCLLKALNAARILHSRLFMQQRAPYWIPRCVHLSKVRRSLSLFSLVRLCIVLVIVMSWVWLVSVEAGLSSHACLECLASNRKRRVGCLWTDDAAKAITISRKLIGWIKAFLEYDAFLFGSVHSVEVVRWMRSLCASSCDTRHDWILRESQWVVGIVPGSHLPPREYILTIHVQWLIQLILTWHYIFGPHRQIVVPLTRLLAEGQRVLLLNVEVNASLARLSENSICT